MTLMDLFDPGVSALAAAILGAAARGMTRQVVAEIRALRQEFAEHAASDAKQFAEIRHALQQTWANQRR